MRFAKAHGLGNDFILVEETALPAPHGALAVPGACATGTWELEQTGCWLAWGQQGVGCGCGTRTARTAGSSGNGVRCPRGLRLAQHMRTAEHVERPPGPGR